jgi:hypothetical protein
VSVEEIEPEGKGMVEKRLGGQSRDELQRIRSWIEGSQGREKRSGIKRKLRSLMEHSLHGRRGIPRRDRQQPCREEGTGQGQGGDRGDGENSQRVPRCPEFSPRFPRPFLPFPCLYTYTSTPIFEYSILPII